jgi:MFS family permease
MPLLGSALGPLIGGALGNVSLKEQQGTEQADQFQSFGWRSSFYFLAAFAGTVEVLFLFFPETWRKEVGSRVAVVCTQSGADQASGQSCTRRLWSMRSSGRCTKTR